MLVRSRQTPQILCCFGCEFRFYLLGLFLGILDPLLGLNGLWIRLALWSIHDMFQVVSVLLLLGQVLPVRLLGQLLLALLPPEVRREVNLGLDERVAHLALLLDL